MSLNFEVYVKLLLTRVQKTHWHWVMVVICSKGNSPRHSLQDTSGSRAKSHVGRYLAVVMVPASELKNITGHVTESLTLSYGDTNRAKLLSAVNLDRDCCSSDPKCIWKAQTFISIAAGKLLNAH